jgi:hypothetical protein
MSLETTNNKNNDFVDSHDDITSDFGRLGLKGWNRMEKSLEGTDAKVVKALDALANGTKIISTSNMYKTFGEDIYVNVIRSELNNLRSNIVDLKKIKKNDIEVTDIKKKKLKPGQGGKSSNKKIEIISINRDKTIIDILEEKIKKPLKLPIHNTSHGICYNSEYIDVKGCALLVGAYDFTDKTITKTKTIILIIDCITRCNSP